MGMPNDVTAEDIILAIEDVKKAKDDYYTVFFKKTLLDIEEWERSSNAAWKKYDAAKASLSSLIYNMTGETPNGLACLCN